MNRKCHWIPFEKDRITEAARLLVTLRNESIGGYWPTPPSGNRRRFG